MEMRREAPLGADARARCASAAASAHGDQWLGSNGGHLVTSMTPFIGKVRPGGQGTFEQEESTG